MHLQGYVKNMRLAAGLKMFTYDNGQIHCGTYCVKFFPAWISYYFGPAAFPITRLNITLFSMFNTVS